jgi:hypothetical protein
MRPLIFAILFIAFAANSYAYPSGQGGWHSGSTVHNSRQYNGHNRNDSTAYYPGYYGGGYIAPDDDAVVVDDDGEDDVAPPPEQQQTWVGASNGQVPYGAVVNTTDTGHPDGPAYYCQGVYNNQYEEGMLIPSEGCFIQDPANGATVVLSSYEVLVFVNP